MIIEERIINIRNEVIEKNIGIGNIENGIIDFYNKIIRFLYKNGRYFKYGNLFSAMRILSQEDIEELILHSKSATINCDRTNHSYLNSLKVQIERYTEKEDQSSGEFFKAELFKFLENHDMNKFYLELNKLMKYDYILLHIFEKWDK